MVSSHSCDHTSDVGGACHGFGYLGIVAHAPVVDPFTVKIDEPQVDVVLL